MKRFQCPRSGADKDPARLQKFDVKDIAIIGSGITALSHAWELQRKGHQCLVLESSEHIGGSIRSVRDGEYLAEEGPNSIQLNTPELEDFLNSIPGLSQRVVEAEAAAKKRFIVRSGQLHAVPMNPIQAVTTRLWSLRGRLRVLREPFIPAIAPEVEESAASFVRRRLGEELYQYAINPLIGGIYAGDPEQLSLRYAFPKLHALERLHGGLIKGGLAKMRETKRSPNRSFRKRIISFRDGLGELTTHLAFALGEKLQTGVSIESFARKGEKWSIRFDGRAREFDKVIVTAPAHQLATLPFEAEIISRFEALRSIQYPPVSVLTLAYDRENVVHPLDGFGALVPECENRSILGVLFPSSIFRGRAPDGEVLLTVFVGGERQPHLATENTEALSKTVSGELRELLGARGAPKFIHHRHWPMAIPQYKLGYGSILRSISDIEDDFPSLSLQGNYRTGVSLSYCIESALQR